MSVWSVAEIQKRFAAFEKDFFDCQTLWKQCVFRKHSVSLTPSKMLFVLITESTEWEDFFF